VPIGRYAAISDPYVVRGSNCLKNKRDPRKAGRYADKPISREMCSSLSQWSSLLTFRGRARARPHLLQRGWCRVLPSRIISWERASRSGPTWASNVCSFFYANCSDVCRCPSAKQWPIRRKNDGLLRGPFETLEFGSG